MTSSDNSSAKKVSAKKVIVRHLGMREYEATWLAMKEFSENRTEETVDEIWLLQHPAVFTQGQAGKAEHILDAGDIPVVKIDRGGQVTYHGPGQLVVYLLLNIKRRRIGVRALVDVIEQSLIALLKDYGVASEAKKEAPGVYVQGAKIAALGLRIRRGCSYHGLSFNLDMDLSPYERINPCGYEGLAVTQLKDCLAVNHAQKSATLAQLMAKVGQGLQNVLVLKLGYSQIIESR